MRTGTERRYGVFLALTLLLSSGVLRAEGALTSVRLSVHWRPQAQFAGYYVAADKGFYRQAGLEVLIDHGGPDRFSWEVLEKGGADIATMFLSTAVRMRAEGVPLVNIAQLVRRASYLLVARKQSGIRTPKDLDGKRISIWDNDFRLQTRAFFQKYQVKPEIIVQSTNINLFLRGAVDAASAMLYNEYHLLLNSGLEPDELTIFRLADHGIDFPEDGIYCLEALLQKHPELPCRFVQATLRGWQEAFARPEEALSLIMRTIRDKRIPNSLAHQRWMLARMKELIQGGAPDQMGTLGREPYLRVARALQEGQLIRALPDYEGFVHDCRTGPTPAAGH